MRYYGEDLYTQIEVPRLIVVDGGIAQRRAAVHSVNSA